MSITRRGCWVTEILTGGFSTLTERERERSHNIIEIFLSIILASLLFLLRNLLQADALYNIAIKGTMNFSRERKTANYKNEVLVFAACRLDWRNVEVTDKQLGHTYDLS